MSLLSIQLAQLVNERSLADQILDILERSAKPLSIYQLARRLQYDSALIGREIKRLYRAGRIDCARKNSRQHYCLYQCAQQPIIHTGGRYA